MIGLYYLPLPTWAHEVGFTDDRGEGRIGQVGRGAVRLLQP